MGGRWRRGAVLGSSRRHILLRELAFGKDILGSLDS